MFQTICLLICFQLIQGKALDQLDENDKRPLCPCGRNGSSVNTRVVGGHATGRNEFPYAASLIYAVYVREERSGLTSYCGGTLITDRHILTAAHCLRDKSPDNIMADVGAYSLRDEKDGTIIPAEKFISYPEYHSNSFHTDIGIVELKEPVPFEMGIYTVILPSPGLELKAGTTVTVYGWGRLSWEGRHADTLQAVELPVMDNEVCKPKFTSKIERNMMCAGGEEGKDACIGDSGSGLVVQLDNEYVLCGVVSFGRHCALPGIPGVYSKVSNYTAWILEKTKTAGCRPCVYGQD